MEEKQRVRILFWLLIPVLLLGFGLSLAGLEPYPAIVFPAFESTGSKSGDIEFEKPGFFLSSDQRDAEAIDQALILAKLPESFHSAILQNRLRHPNGSGLPEKRMDIDLGGRHYVVKRTPKVWSEKEVEACTAYLLDLIPQDWHEAGLKLEVRWYRYVQLAGTDQAEQKELLEVLEWPLIASSNLPTHD